jgi:type III restriction enzyme
MTNSFIPYDNELPEIPGRRPWEKPSSYLVKDTSIAAGWRVETQGRRPSQLLLVPKIRTQVDAWRDSGYPGASNVTKRLFSYWFEEEHEISGFNVPFRYYFCQREAIETLVWIIEIAQQRDVQTLIQQYSTIYKKDLFNDTIAFQTTIDGQRQLRRYVPESDATGIQDLPPADLCRLAFKMATGSGKTWVMAMVIVWARFHKLFVSGSQLSTNFLVVAPNVIVYQRLERDFAANRVFYEIPLIPPEWLSSFSQKVILRGEETEPDATGNLILTNIQQLYESRDEKWTPKNAIDALLGRKPAKDSTISNKKSLLERIKSVKDIIVINDEAHHVHDNNLAWNQSLLAIHRALPKGLGLWLDFSATPKDQQGMFFPWTICDYPLAQAVEDRIVKSPLIVNKEDNPTKTSDSLDAVTSSNVGEKYGYWIKAAVERWKAHDEIYTRLNTRPVLFIMAEKNAFADAIGEYLWKTPDFKFKQNEILVIHTDRTGEVKQGDLEAVRAAARDIDKANSTVKAIVSVMMLREGWDVRNVTVVLGLRPFTAKAEILPEQVIGRGLRLMTKISPDRTQTLEVLGTPNLLNVLRNQLEVEGVGVASTKNDPVLPVIITPVQERLKYDISIPITKPSLEHNFRKLSDLDIKAFDAIYDQDELAEPFRIRLKLQFATTETTMSQVDVSGTIQEPREILARITNMVIDQAKLPNQFALLYPFVRDYVTTKCLGKSINLEDSTIRSHLTRLEIQESIARYLARKIAGLTIERRAIEFDKANFRISDTKSFSWRRDLPPLEATKTIFNYVATYNGFERQFATFLDNAHDVVRFAALGTTEQGDSGTQFRVDYIKPNGAIGFYHPDWVVVQKIDNREKNWIIETKGRVWEGTTAKDDAMKVWCARISDATRTSWNYARINQSDFNNFSKSSFIELIESNPLI